MTAPVRLPWAETRKGPLVLVNRDHPLRSPLVPDLVPLAGGWPDQHLDRTAARMLTECIPAAGGAGVIRAGSGGRRPGAGQAGVGFLGGGGGGGGGRPRRRRPGGGGWGARWARVSPGGAGVILPVSGWRSRGEQQAIWDRTLETDGPDFTARYVARPGCSEHETGLAVDLALAADVIDPICPAFPRDGVCGRFRALAADYGFIERYTEEKQPITGIGAEPWHFRYVGVPHARLLTENALCLEEYRAFLQQGDRTVRLPGGRRVTVGWLPCRSAAVRWTPPAACWQVSGDNDGGFITTVWEG